MYSIFDVGVIDRHTEMYRAWVLQPESTKRKPAPPQPRLSNWHPEDKEAYCGGEYVSGATSRS